MATTRKKQDEKNLKTLRELVSLQHNKYCFDCNQRGPTYVNVTIGSFVCTKCSGILRGLTPPHRVKSISMATFTTEEIDLIKNRGNDYCKRVWLGLYEGSAPSDSRDEQTVRDFMVEKYERKRYYLEPSQALQNGYKPQTTSSGKGTVTKPLTSLISDPRPLRVNGSVRSGIRGVENDFVADFSSANIFSAVNNNNNNANGTSFANFDNNPIFNSAENDFSIFDLNFSNNGPAFNQVPLFPKCDINRWSMPPVSLNNSNQQQSVLAPSEDRYAALKDLDNALKVQPAVQPTIDWNSGSNSSLYSSSTTAGSLYSSPSPQGSMYGSPSQGQFGNSAFQTHDSANTSNPFNSGGVWGNGNGSFNMTNGVHPHVNPFRAPEVSKTNNFTNFAFQPAVNGSPWTPNPFKVGTASGSNSSNPFL